MVKIWTIAAITTLLLLYVMIGWTDSNLDWIVTAVSGTPKDVPFIISALVTFIFNGLALAFNVVVFIIRLVVG